jgi:hypothetical protein
MAEVFSDDFNRSDSDAPGGNWTEQGSADYDIVSNRLRSVAGSAGEYCFNTSAIGSANYECEADIYYPSGMSNGGPGVVGRATSTSNFYLLLKTFNDNEFQLGKIVSGTYTVLSTFNVTVGETAKIKLSMNGTTIKAYVGDVEQASVTDSALSSEGDFGCRSYSAASASPQEWDNYKVYDFTVGGQTISPTGISSAEAFGSPQLNLTALPTGIDSGEAFGNSLLELFLLPTGIDSGELFGSPTFELFLLPTGVGSDESFGSPQLNLTILPDGVGSGESFGQPTVTGGEAVIAPVGIDSAEAFGNALLSLFLLPDGIGSGETFGQPLLNFIVDAVGVASAEAFGNPQLNLTLLPDGIDSGESFGQPTMQIYLLPTGVSSGEMFGTPQLNLTLLMVGIASAETFGTLTLTGGLTIAVPIAVTVQITDEQTVVMTLADEMTTSIIIE